MRTVQCVRGWQGWQGFGFSFGLDCQKASELVFWAWAGLRAGLGWACGVWAGLAGLRLSGCLPKWLAVAGFGLWALDLTVTAKKLVSLGFLGLGGAWAGLGRGWTWA